LLALATASGGELLVWPCSRCWASWRFARRCNRAGSGVGIGSRCGWDFNSSQFIGRCILAAFFCLHYNADGNFIADWREKDALQLKTPTRCHDLTGISPRITDRWTGCSEETTF